MGLRVNASRLSDPLGGGGGKRNGKSIERSSHTSSPPLYRAVDSSGNRKEIEEARRELKIEGGKNFSKEGVIKMGRLFGTRETFVSEILSSS